MNCDICDRPIVENDEGNPNGPECSYPNGKSCKAYAATQNMKRIDSGFTLNAGNTTAAAEEMHDRAYWGMSPRRYL